MFGQVNSRLIWVFAGTYFLALIVALPVSMNSVELGFDVASVQTAAAYDGAGSVVDYGAKPTGRVVRNTGIGTGQVIQFNAGMKDQVVAQGIVKLFLILGSEGQSLQNQSLGAVLIQ